jgi:nitrogen-specific signal transduction histidine kinase
MTKFLYRQHTFKKLKKMNDSSNNNKKPEIMLDMELSYAEEQKEFKKNADQVVHDIRSPLASLQMFAKFCPSLPKEERSSLINITTNISNIANDLLNKYNHKDHTYYSNTQHEDKPQLILISSLLAEVINEKKYQYIQYPVEFILHIPQNSDLAWLNIHPTSLKRALSNIINNAVDALGGKAGKIILQLVISTEHIAIIVSDNGMGMPDEVKNKIMQGISVTSGKKDGHGIGMGQVKEMLQHNKGILEISSMINFGTSVKLTFPRITPDCEIKQAEHVDLVIIDDDELLLDTFSKFLFKGMVVDTYINPHEFLDNMDKYTCETKIAIDNNYKNSDLKGADIAQRLHDRGYTNLYILSGENPEDIDCGGYATALLKTDIDNIQKILS